MVPLRSALPTGRNRACGPNALPHPAIRERAYRPITRSRTTPNSRCVPYRPAARQPAQNALVRTCAVTGGPRSRPPRSRCGRGRRSGPRSIAVSTPRTRAASTCSPIAGTPSSAGTSSSSTGHWATWPSLSCTSGRRLCPQSVRALRSTSRSHCSSFACSDALPPRGLRSSARSRLSCSGPVSSRFHTAVSPAFRRRRCSSSWCRCSTGSWNPRTGRAPEVSSSRRSRRCSAS